MIPRNSNRVMTHKDNMNMSHLVATLYLADLKQLLLNDLRVTKRNSSVQEGLPILPH